MVDTTKKNKLKVEQQVERMMNEGLGGGQIAENKDEKKFKIPESQKTSKSRNKLENDKKE